ncbi:hypothetical protein [Vibrio aquimaris]|uniref:Uncharacterized protein n=1 Tax=Vibrio aquimaris TaxID=2587862 RepID=A0A5P9CNK9_9VIBR|nr:hypothetical protein [Vibrio aquimaris]QFT27835.1 hypothetical protein FIV01_15710 [Vibrio aquimaris]
MSVTRQPLTFETLISESPTQPNQDKLNVFSEHCQKILLRVIQLNASTPHTISLDVHGDSADLFWFYNDGPKLDRPSYSDPSNWIVYTWQSIEEINQFFLEANIGLDLLEAETKAA